MAPELSIAPRREQTNSPGTTVTSVEDTPAVATPIVLSALQMLGLLWAGVALALVGWLVAGALSVRRIANKRPRAHFARLDRSTL